MGHRGATVEIRFHTADVVVGARQHGDAVLGEIEPEGLQGAADPGEQRMNPLPEVREARDTQDPPVDARWETMAWLTTSRGRVHRPGDTGR
jgi:hypothetical protein